MNTIRTFTALLKDTTEDTRITFYHPGTIPTPVSSNRVASNIEYLNLVVNLPNIPAVGEYSGRTILFELFASNQWIQVARLDFRPGIVPYTVDLIEALWGERAAVLSPDSKLACKLLDTGYGYLSENETLSIYGSATEQIEFNQDTIIQQLN